MMFKMGRDRDEFEELRRRDEERQRTIDIILKQQAQFAVGMEQLREAQARAEEKWGGMWERTSAGINALLAAAQLQAHEIDGLTKAQAQLVESQANTDRQMAETTEKLNALIDVVGQLIGERRNGG
jgi:ABC-type transporter Mla subunit MlaD